MSGGLADVRVINLIANRLGPVATQIPSDRGAEIIKAKAAQGALSCSSAGWQA